MNILPRHYRSYLEWATRPRSYVLTNNVYIKSCIGDKKLRKKRSEIIGVFKRRKAKRNVGEIRSERRAVIDGQFVEGNGNENMRHERRSKVENKSFEVIGRCSNRNLRSRSLGAGFKRGGQNRRI